MKSFIRSFRVIGFTRLIGFIGFRLVWGVGFGKGSGVVEATVACIHPPPPPAPTLSLLRACRFVENMLPGQAELPHHLPHQDAQVAQEPPGLLLEDRARDD